MRRIVFLSALGVALVVALGVWNPLKGVSAANRDAQRTAPTYRVDASWPKPLPSDTSQISPTTGEAKPWVTGEVAGTCIDSNDHVITVNRGNLVAPEDVTAVAAPPVIEFDQQGNVVNAWGDRNVLPNGIHGCFVDFQDNIWIAGNGDGIVQKWSHDGSQMLLQIGTRGTCDGPAVSSRPTNPTCGNPGTNTSKTLLNQPADMTVDPSNGDIYIADGYGNHRVVVFDKEGNYLRQWGTSGTGPGEFQPADGGHPHCVVLGKDDLLYTCDRGSDRIQVFQKDPFLTAGKCTGGDQPVCQPEKIIPVKPGTGVGGLGTAGSAWDVDFSPDRNQDFMFDSDGGNEIVWIFDRAAANILSGFGRPGHQAGEFTFLHTVAVDSKGNVYTGETINGRRVQKFVRHGAEAP